MTRQPSHPDELPVSEATLALEAETGTGGLQLSLGRRLAAEALGTALLVMAVVGSGIMATRLSEDVGLQLLQNALATTAALVGLILMFGQVSGAHVNPAVTVLDRLLGSVSTRDAASYAVAQVIGACAGSILANVMFELPAIELSQTTRSSGALWLSELVATVTLLLLIQSCVRSGRAACAAAELRWCRSRWAPGSVAPTGSPRRRASPTPP
jgi:glycerol uptake facilitator-like aquaporin